MQKIRQFTRWLFDTSDIAPLIFFRIAFGGVMLWEVWRYFHFDRIARYYVEPTFFFHYSGFQWIHPLPGNGMFLLFYFLGFLSVAILIGLFYRISIILFWLCFTYIFLLDQAQYLNHFYLISLVSFLMIFIPAHRALSIDTLLRPATRAQIAPNWSLWLLRMQMAFVYIFGGIAKINPDWLAGEPLRQWLAERTDFPIIGIFFSEEWMVFLFSYGGLLFDLLVVPFLLWKRTRIAALLLALAFHLTNARLFNIGIFPWFAIAMTLLFLPPGWFRPKLLRSPIQTGAATPSGGVRQRWILIGIIAYFSVQSLLPMRHWLYPGYASWTEEGHTLAWHMRLRDKAGTIAFYASDPISGTTWRLAPDTYLSSRQFDQMKDNPHMILRFAHYLAETLESNHPGVQIRAWAMTSLNSRAPQLLIDPTADLAQEPDDLLASDWILPLVQQPVPHKPLPALLVSRRYGSVMLLINITRSVYTLDHLSIHTAKQTLNGLDFGVTALLPGECVLAYAANADLSHMFVPCNEAGSRLLIPPALLDEIIEIETATTQSTCGEIICIVVDEGETTHRSSLQ